MKNETIVPLEGKEVNRAPEAKKDLKGTKTEKNLMEAFAGESMARNKYTYFASKAKKDGYVQISKIFEETAANEKEHAEALVQIPERRQDQRHRCQPR